MRELTSRDHESAYLFRVPAGPAALAAFHSVGQLGPDEILGIDAGRRGLFLWAG